MSQKLNAVRQADVSQGKKYRACTKFSRTKNMLKVPFGIQLKKKSRQVDNSPDLLSRVLAATGC